MANATAKPSGLTIKRNGNLKFALTWKIIDKNYSGGQHVRWRIWKTETTYTDWTNVTVSASATSTTVTASVSDYYPNSGKPKVYAFEFEVQGKRGNETSNHVTTTYDWSDWASSKHLIRVPNKPTVTATLNASNKTTFAYTSETDDGDWKPFRYYEYQSILLQDCKEYNGSKLKWVSSNAGWNTSTSSSAGSKYYTEDSATIANKSYTRWFRVRAVGCAGASDWTYSKHVYAKPNRPVITDVKATTRSGNTNVTVTWVAATNASRPIDETSIQYMIATPGNGLTVPSGGSWTEAASIIDTSGSDSVNFVVSNVAGNDQVMFVRVVAEHDSNTNPSDAKIADYGALSAPTSLSASMSSSYVASISVTNNSAVPDARVAIIYRDSKGKDTTVAITSAGSGAKTLSNIQCPTGTVKKFYAYAFQGSYSSSTLKNNVVSYSIDSNMESSKVADSASVSDIPVAPTNLTVTAKANGRAYVTWDMNWNKATATIISWSDYKYAWNSNESPQTYTRNSDTAHSAYISGIEPGHVWYFRARFIGEVDGEEVRSPLTDRVTLDRTAVPDAPVLSLSKGVVRPGGSLKASWTYSSEDGTKQAAAEVCIASTITDGVVTAVGNRVLSVKTSKTGTIKTTGWTTGQTYNLCVRVTSNTGKVSDWSDPVPFYLGAPMTCSVSMTNIASTTVTDAGSNTRTAVVMSALPATVTVTGAGAGGTTTLLITRAEDYPIERPDGSIRDGYSGETVFIHRQTGEGTITINRTDLVGELDDGAQYTLRALVEDGNGQSAEYVTDFEVHWNYKPTIPTGTVSTSSGVAVLSATATSTQTGDTVDIYRLSVDTPQLIVKGGTLGTNYVDPYPTLGENGGYRFVHVSKYGDYITSSDTLAWADVPTNLDNQTGYIHFNGEAIPVDFNVQVSSAWSKDFKETKYLGGTVRGDWNPAVSRSISVNMVVPSEDTATIQKLRRLADWPGICHVRTQDGSSYAADVQVSGNAGYDVGGRIESYTLKITRVEPQELDGVLQSLWS